MFEHALTAYPKKLHQIVDHGKSICLQLDDIDITLSKLEDGEFLQQNTPGVAVEIKRQSTNFGRIGIRIPKPMLIEILNELGQRQSEEIIAHKLRETVWVAKREELEEEVRKHERLYKTKLNEIREKIKGVCKDIGEPNETKT